MRAPRAQGQGADAADADEPDDFCAAEEEHYRQLQLEWEKMEAVQKAVYEQEEAEEYAKMVGEQAAVAAGWEVLREEEGYGDGDVFDWLED